MNGSKPVLKMGGAGDPPAPVGDPPTGTATSHVAKRPCPLARTVAPVPSGESPDGTGGSPVLPANHFSNSLSKRYGPSGDHRTAVLFLLLAAALLCPVAGLQAADGDWPVYLGDKASTHFSTLEQINRNNVQRLQVAWTCHRNDPGI